MPELRISAEARRDLRDISDRGVEAFGENHARHFMLGFERLFALLRDQPLAGQERPDIEMGIRSLSHRPYRLFYRSKSDEVLIIRIIHHARDVRQALLLHQ